MNQHFIYRFDPESPAPRPVDGLIVKRYDASDMVGMPVQELVAQYYGDRIIAGDLRQLEEDATMWIGFLDEVPVACVFTRKGHSFRRWFVPLQADDIVIYRGRTLPDYRGRGIFPNMYRPVAAAELPPGATMYTDAHVRNHASNRNIAKAGFVCIGKMKPLTREMVMGTDE